MFVVGCWLRKFGAFVAAQMLVALAVTFAYSWLGLGGHLASLSALDPTRLAAALPVGFLAGRDTPIRPATGSGVPAVDPPDTAPLRLAGPLIRPAEQGASDADQDTAVDILCAAVAKGRLTLAALDERVGGRAFRPHHLRTGRPDRRPLRPVDARPA